MANQFQQKLTHLREPQRKNHRQGIYAPLLHEPDFPGKEQIEMPLVHVHCFTKEIEPEKGEQDILEVSGA
jgi:hypothetical protein